MAEEGFQNKLLRKLTAFEGERLAAERSRAKNSAGVDNVYRDRRAVRSPCYRMHISRMRDLAIAAGLFGAIVVHQVFGINLTFCAIAFGVCGVVIFEWQRREREKREQHFD